MAAIPDVIGGETITSEWGNTIRDAIFESVVFGGAQEETGDSSLSTSYENGAATTFTKPAIWVSYQLMTWGVVVFGGTASQFYRTQMTIGASSNPGPATGTASPANVWVTMPAQHTVSGLTAATQLVVIQYRLQTGTGGAKLFSSLNYIATRLT